jgi:hypothetical protein
MSMEAWGGKESGEKGEVQSTKQWHAWAVGQDMGIRKTYVVSLQCTYVDDQSCGPGHCVLGSILHFQPINNSMTCETIVHLPYSILDILKIHPWMCGSGEEAGRRGEV